MWEDYWAHRYFDDPKSAEQEHVDDDFDLDEVLTRLDNGDAEWVTEMEARYDRN